MRMTAGDFHDKEIRCGFVTTFGRDVQELPLENRALSYATASKANIEEQYLLLNIRAELLVITVRFVQETVRNPMHEILKVREELGLVEYKYPHEDAVKDMFALRTPGLTKFESKVGIAIIRALVSFAEQTQARRIELLREDTARIERFKAMAARIA